MGHKKWDYVRHKNHNTHLQKTKWPNRDRTTPSSMALFGHYLAKNHPTKNAIEQKYSPRARASSGHDHPTRYHKEIVEFVLGGGSLVTINNGGLSIADEISFFRIFKYIWFSRPRTVWGGNATHNIMLFKQQSAIIFLEQSSSLSSHNNKHDGSLGYSNNYW